MPILLGETLELALLFSWLPERLYGWLVEQTLPLVARYQPPRHPGGLAAARPPRRQITRRAAWAGCAPRCLVKWRQGWRWWQRRSPRRGTTCAIGCW
jgi:hypothetical protein